jgi:uncharacterized protein YndB with AHSA1/START domain
MSEEQNNIDPILVSTEVQVSSKKAFPLFVDKFGEWYPRAYTWSGKKLETIEIGSHEGARCFERGPHHFEADWGRVLIYRPPNRLVLTWQIGFNRQPISDPEQSSEIEVTFTDIDKGQSTKVALRHYKFEQHDEDGNQYREALASPEGWPFILDQFKKFAAGV